MKPSAEPMQKKNSQGRGGYIFLAIVLILYAGTYLLKPEVIERSLVKSALLLVRLLPVFCFVILFMTTVNYFVTPRAVSKYVGKESGLRGWLLALTAGILSHGPVYMWFPFLKELRAHGMTSGLSAVFLYSRAIKIPLLAVMVYYFGILFTVVLQCWLIAAAILEGILIELTTET